MKTRKSKANETVRRGRKVVKPLAHRLEKIHQILKARREGREPIIGSCVAVSARDVRMTASSRRVKNTGGAGRSEGLAIYVQAVRVNARQCPDATTGTGSAGA